MGASGGGTGRGVGAKCESYGRKRDAGVRVVVELGVGVERSMKDMAVNAKQWGEW